MHSLVALFLWQRLMLITLTILSNASIAHNSKLSRPLTVACRGAEGETAPGIQPGGKPIRFGVIINGHQNFSQQPMCKSKFQISG